MFQEHDMKLPSENTANNSTHYQQTTVLKVVYTLSIEHISYGTHCQSNMMWTTGYCANRTFLLTTEHVSITGDCSSFTYLPVDWSGHFMRTSGDRNPGVPALGADWLLLQSMICQVQIFRKGYYIGLYTVSKLWGSIQCGNKMEVWKKLFKGKG